MRATTTGLKFTSKVLNATSRVQRVPDAGTLPEGLRDTLKGGMATFNRTEWN